ncbi:Co2+/Mg2+ efflux protein ApaG [Parashewanella curva]|uniref:Protein ApaG n=1 Tax=Parashewanella curva TaxID=2338552 RepID=A0A3L8PSQ4_9GAMM|nr:Co2+/Mg2+ efflux protein ApaG [Parashewanella curva]RLV58450.1 Co2+/Mg2+ efflux protein ApaG [Parashewanella curva]
MSESESPIRVEVSTEYIDDQSSPDEDKYVFAYTITIINLSDKKATLKNRHWIITDGNGKQTEVQGDGVVGETPTIPPNSAYQYTSGTLLDTPLGFMEGFYGMVTEDNKDFRAPIPMFRLAAPGTLH